MATSFHEGVVTKVILETPRKKNLVRGRVVQLKGKLYRIARVKGNLTQESVRGLKSRIVEVSA